MKVSELTGAYLEYWVARSDGVPASQISIHRLSGSGVEECLVTPPTNGFHCDPGPQHYSTDWTQGGPLIDRFNVDIGHELDGTFWASIAGPTNVPESDVGSLGATRLVAAMRCIVSSVYGNNVPDLLP